MSVAEKRALKLKEVVGLVSLSSATIYRMILSGEFPRPVRVGRRAARWRAGEVDEWLASRPYTAPESPGKAEEARR